MILKDVRIDFASVSKASSPATLASDSPEPLDASSWQTDVVPFDEALLLRSIFMLALSIRGRMSLTFPATRWPNGPWPSKTPQKARNDHAIPNQTVKMREKRLKRGRNGRNRTSQKIMASWLTPFLPCCVKSDATRLSPFPTNLPGTLLSSSSSTRAPTPIVAPFLFPAAHFLCLLHAGTLAQTPRSSPGRHDPIPSTTYQRTHFRAGGILNNTLRPSVPSSCDVEWRKLMEQCWAANPDQRPSFTQIAAQLRSIIQNNNSAEGQMLSNDT
ncbi:hypothetical protein ACMD2_17451 [Ananas comosus]|uniref:Serine-threonine/tyrosine-protein kinase catalytic domain-containing protein n=1 Tax=Ananas comosus TaxID=4615 RepID=A0A199VI78_ANACO|nr:hypothetical protein ACMD2_17451 [Ananas comosus]